MSQGLAPAFGIGELDMREDLALLAQHEAEVVRAWPAGVMPSRELLASMSEDARILLVLGVLDPGLSVQVREQHRDLV